MRRMGSIFLITFIGLFFSSCEDKEESNLFKAQECLNRATVATAASCNDIISGQTSEQSYVIRCSVAFMAEGIDELAIIEALKNIKGEEGGDPTAPAIAALSMSTAQASTDALNNCTLTGSDALISLANFANVATVLGIALGGIPTDPTSAQIEALIDSYNPGSTATAQEKEDLGNAIIASQASLCNSEEGLFKDTTACKDINQAVTAGNSDPAAIADALIANFKDDTN